ncbi:uncharacterized protein [Triticum aestivum]|uniref:uncharacterized protein n=1 Tax=Triticum aestivum TaxID=4565 RepID=UPI001D0326D3|nr:uncharacterized protein LOC123160743 [Triticum aestivum]
MPARKAAWSSHRDMSMAAFTTGSKQTPLFCMSVQSSSAPPMASMTSHRVDAGAAMAFKVVEIPACSGLLTSSTTRNNSSLRNDTSVAASRCSSSWVRAEVWMLCARIWKCCDHCCPSLKPITKVGSFYCLSLAICIIRV